MRSVIEVAKPTPTDGPKAEMGAKLVPFSSIPVIDIAALRGDDRAAIDAAVAEIGRACEEVGFFYIKNHGIPEALIERTYELSRRFHYSPFDLKNKVHIRESPGTRGWVPVSGEDDDGDPELYRLVEPNPDYDYLTKPRLHAAFDVALELPQDDPDFLAGNLMLVPNQWPDWIPEFREQVMEYYAAVTEVGHSLFRAFAIRLGLPEDFFIERATKAPSQLRLLHYPPNDLPMNNDNLGIGAHSDFECFTILNTRGPGLQVMNAADEWVAAPPIEGTFVVNVGDLLEGWTNGRFKATQHRVVNTGRERFSIPLFFAVDYDVVIEPLAPLVSEDNPPKYNRIVAGDHLAGFSVHGAKHLRRKIVNGDLKIDFPIHKENPFKRKAVNEFKEEGAGVEAETAPSEAG
ncbi:MAG: 2-oxoglutarate and iron-dependent oxygenase domain-containing protein [Caulobacteraceae bacterium]|nr:2-oxoglutarate and iron-dependent oxygenase domain-containing protein [Caulobacteraceae bacterium]